MKILKGNTVNFEITINLSSSGLVGVNLEGLTLQIAAINNSYVIKIPSSEITIVDSVNGVISFVITGTNLTKVGFYTIELVVVDNANSDNIYRNLIPNAFVITENAYEVDDSSTITDEIVLQRISKDGADGGTPTVTIYLSTDDTYILRVTNADGTSFNTPNLKGSSGSDGDSGSDGTSLTYYGQYASLAIALATIPTSELKEGLLIRVLNNSNVGIIYVYQNGQWVLFLTDGDDGVNGENGTSGVDGTTYKWMYSATADRNVEPDCSITFLDPNTNLTIALWQYSPDITTTELPYLWMILALFNSNGDVVILTSGTYWTLPVCITGVDGQNGTDGSGVEFIYQVGTSSTVPATPYSQNTNDYVPSGWTNHPSGVSLTYMYEYLCQRTKTGDTWGDFQAPVIWSKWGEKGQDGDGYEYIFATTQTSTTPTTPTATGTADDEVPSGWYDEPISVSAIYPYEWVSIRKKTDGVWSSFSTPALWAKYAVNGSDGSAGRYGVTIRTTTWQTGTGVSSPVTYRNDSDSTETRLVYYLDIVLYYESDGTTTLWQCVQTHNSYTGNTHTPGTDTAYWASIEEATPIHTALLLADNAKINLGLLNDLIITKLVSGNLQVTAGLSGDTTNNDGTDVRFWSGALSTQKSSAPFRVTEDGTMYATKANITGSITASNGLFNGLLRNTTNTRLFSLNTNSSGFYYLTANTDFNLTVGSSYSSGSTLCLPTGQEYDGVKCTIINSGVYDINNDFQGYNIKVIVKNSESESLKSFYASSLASGNEILEIQLLTVSMLKLWAFWRKDLALIDGGELIWFIENPDDFTATLYSDTVYYLTSKTGQWS